MKSLHSPPSMIVFFYAHDFTTLPPTITKEMFMSSSNIIRSASKSFSILPFLLSMPITLAGVREAIFTASQSGTPTLLYIFLTSLSVVATLPAMQERSASFITPSS